MKPHRIMIRSAGIAQAERDVWTLRQQLNNADSQEAAEALQDAIDRARLQETSPNLYSAGSLFPRNEDAMLRDALTLFQTAA